MIEIENVNVLFTRGGNSVVLNKRITKKIHFLYIAHTETYTVLHESYPIYLYCVPIEIMVYKVNYSFGIYIQNEFIQTDNN